MASQRLDRLWHNARLATMSVGQPGLGRVERGAIGCRDGRIAYIGPEAGAAGLAAAERIDCGGRLITPGLIDCHTHLVYGGSRANEFEQRLAGATYEEIARAGGGIASTVKATRRSSEAELAASASARLTELMADGVTTVEIKSGYGLDVATELRQLKVARQLGNDHAVRVVTTVLAAHALPPEFKGNSTGYVDLIVNEIIPAAHRAGLADAVDAFCEGIAFSVAETTRVFEAARALGLPVKLHADQLSNGGGAALAAKFGALSAEHLEYTDDAGAAALGRAGTVAVMLPGAYYFIREKQAPPIDLFRKHGVAMAVATDCNPGSSPLTSLLLSLNMAATLFRMTVDECLLGVTRHAAKALGLAAETGTLEMGKSCDLAIWDVEQPAELVYRIGSRPLHARVFKGV